MTDIINAVAYAVAFALVAPILWIGGAVVFGILMGLHDAAKGGDDEAD